MSNLYIGRQPILNKQKNIFAYALKVYGEYGLSQSEIPIYTQQLEQLTTGLDFNAISAGAPLFITLPRDLIIQLKLPKSLIDGENVVIEIPDDISADADILYHLRHLKKQGLKLALNFSQYNEVISKLIPACDYIKLPPQTLLEPEQLQKITAHKTPIIADPVEDEHMFDRLAKLKIKYFQGYFFTDPVQINNTTISENKLSLVNLLAKVNEKDVHFDQLATIVMQDPILSHKLLLTINHSLKNRDIKFTSHKEAIAHIGLNNFKVWINALLFGNLDNAPKELLITTLVRAKFCEHIAHIIGKQNEEESFFLTGLFSNLDAFFRLPMANIIEHLPLAQDIQLALTKQKGVMGAALRIAKFYEAPTGNFNDSHSLQANEKVHLTLSKRKEAFDQAYLNACEWTNSLKTLSHKL